MDESKDYRDYAVPNEYLKEELQQRCIADAAEFAYDSGGICVWQGDITMLKCGTIANAVNSVMTDATFRITALLITASIHL